MARHPVALFPRVPFREEMRDLRRLVHLSPDTYLRLDERRFKRDVLMVGAPGRTHRWWSRFEMWRMATSSGTLPDDVRRQKPALVRRLMSLLDADDASRAIYRVHGPALLTLWRYLISYYNVRTAFPPFHARFFADRYLPSEGDCLVVDPCAGWGGRLLGTLCVNRAAHVRYIGVDPNRNNQEAYAGLTRRVTIWLKREIAGPRSARVYVQPFERWIWSPTARRLRGSADLVITSPPYFRRERYDPDSRAQSHSRYADYDHWRKGFYRALFDGAFRLLKPGGVFVLNVANVSGAPLEQDARRLAREVGFLSHEFFRLAMSRVPGSGRLRHACQVDGVVWKYEPVFVFRRIGNR